MTLDTALPMGTHNPTHEHETTLDTLPNHDYICPDCGQHETFMYRQGHETEFRCLPDWRARAYRIHFIRWRMDAWHTPRTYDELAARVTKGWE